MMQVFVRAEEFHEYIEIRKVIKQDSDGSIMETKHVCFAYADDVRLDDVDVKYVAASISTSLVGKYIFISFHSELPKDLYTG